MRAFKTDAFAWQERSEEVLMLVMLLERVISQPETREMCLWLVFPTFPSCSQMPVLFYLRAMHALGFFISYLTHDNSPIQAKGSR